MTRRLPHARTVQLSALTRCTPDALIHMHTHAFTQRQGQWPGPGFTQVARSYSGPTYDTSTDHHPHQQR